MKEYVNKGNMIIVISHSQYVQKFADRKMALFSDDRKLYNKVLGENAFESRTDRVQHAYEAVHDYKKSKDYGKSIVEMRVGLKET